MSSSSGPIPHDKRTALRIFWGHLRGQNRNSWDSDKIKFLKKIPFFEHLRRKQLEEVAQIVYERDYEENEFVFEVGQPGAALFIIQHGEVAVELPRENEEATQLAVVGKLSFVGELALLDEAPRSASARALTKTKVFALFRKDLDHLSETHPDITTHIYRALATIVGNRLKATNELIDKKLKLVA